MDQRPLGVTGISIAPLVLGTHTFGWTTDEQASFAVLDAFVDRGFNAIDTADVYANWVPGNKGGESETIIGNWLKARPGMRDRVVVFTKVGWDNERPGEQGLSWRWTLEGAERSLTRLGVDRIDILFSHKPDPQTPQEETLAAHQMLITTGKVRSIGASNHNAAQVGDAPALAEQHGLPRYEVVQPHYNLYDRAMFDGPLRDLASAGLA